MIIDMSKVIRIILTSITIVISIVVTSSYLYFILYPIKYVISIFLGRVGLPQEISIWLHISCVAVLCILGQIHAYKWYIMGSTIKKQCSKCGCEVEVSTAPKKVSGFSIEIDPLWGWHMIQSVYQKQMYRPRLHYTCSECGHEEYICPYCHKKIGENDKKCPYCKKRLYQIASGYKII